MRKPWIALLLVAAVTMLASCAVAPASQEDEARTPSGTDEDRAVETPGYPGAMDNADTGEYDTGNVGLEVGNQEPYGAYLTDSEGRALYLFTADTKGGASMCEDACTEDWPPLRATGEPQLGPGVDSSLVDTVQRPDGGRQVTYNGWPLYRYAQDSGAGSTEGQDVRGYGGEWYLISPQGDKIQVEATNPAR